MRVPIFIFVAAICVLVLLFSLVRSRRLKEKYVALWTVVALFIIVLVIFPGLLRAISSALGFEVPSNMLFLMAVVLLLGVAIQLSLEVSRAEDKTRTLAEHVAILNWQIHQLQRQLDEHTTCPEQRSEENATLSSRTSASDSTSQSGN